MADTELQQLEKTDRNPVQETRYQELLRQQGSTGSSSNPIASNAADLLKMYQQANAPVVSALESTIPTIGKKYEQTGQYLQKQVGNLDQRYNDLLNSIKGLQQNDVQNVTTNTSAELGRRGISAESGLFGKTVNEAIQPVNRGYAGQIGELGATRQSALDTLLAQISGLPTQQTQEEQAVRTAIAQLQAGGNTNAITGALQLTQQQQALEAQRKQDEAQNAIENLKLQAASATDPLQQAKLMAEIEHLQAQTANLQSGGTGGDPITELMALLGG